MTLAALGLASILGFAVAYDDRGFSFPIIAASEGVGDEGCQGRVDELAASTLEV